MNEKQITRTIYTVMVIGATLILSGIGLIVFTDIYTAKGVGAVMLIAGLIASGLFLLLPAKIYMTLHLMQRNDEKVKEANAKKNAS